MRRHRNRISTFRGKNLDQVDATGSGFLISERRILTNAHVVADSKFVSVTKNKSSKHFPAKVSHIGHECDLAVLTIDDEQFWEGAEILDIAEALPELNESVVVIGYPIGGKTVCVTKGVVSRIELLKYSHARDQLLGIQIDAAINSGNSGGPAIQNDKVIGVAFQNVTNTQNIGHIIPSQVIHHFLNDIERHGKYRGFPSIGVEFQKLPETKLLHRHFGLPKDRTGILVTRLCARSGAEKVLKAHDIILSLDDVAVDNDGTVPFRENSRISMSYIIKSKYDGDDLKIGIWRDGKEISVEMQVHPSNFVIPQHVYDLPARYYVVSGHVFTPVSVPYLELWGSNWHYRAPKDLLKLYIDGAYKDEANDVEHVVLARVLADLSNMGSGDLEYKRILKLNDTDVRNLAHLKELVESCIAQGDDLLTFELVDKRMLVIDAKDCGEATERILDKHNVPAAFSTPLSNL